VSHSTKTAFCPLYFSAHGGRFTDRGHPIFSDQVPGLCDRAFDCGTCSEVSNWVSQMVPAGYRVGWECDKCLKETLFEDRGLGVHRVLPGLYQSSQPDEYEPGFLSGCTRCGWPGTFLQIILRRP
jgi:hypothetical protein